MGRRNEQGRQALLNAVALQDHFTRSLGFDTISHQGHQQFFQELAQLTLAQQFGLVNRPRNHLTEVEWRTVYEQSVERKDVLHGCPICHEHFVIGEQLLLSCSHVFHKKCLKRFEKFSSHRCCPICRTEHYQTMAIEIPSTLYQSFFATRIQAAFRAYKCRKFYADYKWSHPPNDPTKRKDWFAKKLESATNRFLDQIAEDEDNVNTLLADIDNTLASSKQIYNVLESGVNQDDEVLNGDKDVDWNFVIEKAIALERCDTDCSICIMPLLQKEGGATNLALLSCSHLFHGNCVAEYEAFHGSSELLCPICRSMYKRLDL